MDSQIHTWDILECTYPFGSMASSHGWHVQEDLSWKCLWMGVLWFGLCQLHIIKISGLFDVNSLVYIFFPFFPWLN